MSATKLAMAIADVHNGSCSVKASGSGVDVDACLVLVHMQQKDMYWLSSRVEELRVSWHAPV